MKLKAVIVEDELNSRKVLKSLLKHCGDLIEVVGEADTVEAAIDVIKNAAPNLVFLDVELQTGTGFDVLLGLDQRDFDIIFTTAHEQYAVKAIKFSSIDYLLKPIDVEELKLAVQRALTKIGEAKQREQLENLVQNLKQQNKKLHRLCLFVSDGVEYIDVNEIVYCEANGAYTNFYLQNGEKLLVSKHLKEYEALLNEYQFFRVHNSYLVNMHHIKKYVKSDGGYVILSNDHTVSIARNRKENFLNAMSKL